MDWTGGLGWWTELVDWVGGLDWWTGGLDWWTELNTILKLKLTCVGLHFNTATSFHKLEQEYLQDARLN